MLATTATLSGNTAPFTTIPLTFRQLDGSVGFSGQTLVGQLSWSGMTGDAAALGVPSSFTSFCINGLRTIRPGTVTFPQFATDLADFPYGNDSIDTPRANLLESFWRQYGPATAAGFTDKIDSAAFQLAVWEIINDGGLIGSRLSFNLAAGQFSVAAAGLTFPAAARAQQWLAAYDTAGIERNRVDLYALWHQTLQPQVVPVFNPITITATSREQLDAIYRELTSHPSVKLVL